MYANMHLVMVTTIASLLIIGFTSLKVQARVASGTQQTLSFFADLYTKNQNPISSPKPPLSCTGPETGAQEILPYAET